MKRTPLISLSFDGPWNSPRPCRVLIVCIDKFSQLSLSLFLYLSQGKLPSVEILLSFVPFSTTRLFGAAKICHRIDFRPRFSCVRQNVLVFFIRVIGNEHCYFRIDSIEEMDVERTWKSDLTGNVRTINLNWQFGKRCPHLKRSNCCKFHDKSPRTTREHLYHP